MLKLKLFTGSLARIERKINAYFTGHDITDAEVRMVHGRRGWVATVTHRQEFRMTNQPEPSVMNEPKPVDKVRTAPTMTLARREKGGPPVSVALMAGVFPVIEGDKLWSGDMEPAPKPVFLAGTNLKQFGDLFGT